MEIIIYFYVFIFGYVYFGEKWLMGIVVEFGVKVDF